MTVIDPEPRGYWWTPGMDAKELKAAVAAAGGRIVHLDPFVAGGKLRFAAVWASNKEGQEFDWGWEDDITPKALGTRLTDNNERLVTLGSYVLGGARKYCAAWVKATGPNAKKMWWHPDTSPEQLMKALKADGGRLTGLDAWEQDGKVRLAATWVAQEGKDQVASWFNPEVDAETLRGMLKADKGRLVAVAAYLKGGQPRFAAAWVHNAGSHERLWGWSPEATAEQIGQRLDCSILTEIQSYVVGGQRRHLAVWQSYPPSPAPDAADLLRFEGKATLKKVDTVADKDNPNYQWMDFDLSLRNVSSAPVTVSLAQMQYAEANGFLPDLRMDPFAPGGVFAGQPATIPAGGKVTGSLKDVAWSFGLSHVALWWRAKGGGKSQNAMAALPIKRAGFESPPPLPVATPVAVVPFWSPAEIVPLWRGGKTVNWLRVIGQVVDNATAPVTLTALHAVLDVNGKRLLDEPVDPAYFRVKAGARDPVKATGGTLALSTYLTHFVREWDLPEVPANITSGNLRLTLGYNAGGRCGTHSVDTPVVWRRPEPTTLLPPVKGHWWWGGGHPWAAQRHAQDLVMIGPNGRSIRNSDPDVPHAMWANKNTSYWCYGQEVRAMAGGTVIRSDDAHVENDGNVPVAASVVNNVLVRLDDASGSLFHGYYHLMPYKNQVQVGDTVKAGTLLGHVGNSGSSSEPHLHLEAWRIDETGRGRDVPMRFKGMTSGGKAVDAPPEPGAYDT